MEIELLVKMAKQGDKDALVKLIMDKKQEYYKLAFVYLKNKEDALDALEDMIVILHEKINKLKNNEAFYSWSKTILVNCCKKTLKTKNKHVLMEDAEEVFRDNSLEKKEDIIILETYLSKLDKKHQEVLRLRYYLDIDYKGISDILSIPLGTVKSRIFNGLKMLRQSFGGEGYEID